MNRALIPCLNFFLLAQTWLAILTLFRCEVLWVKISLTHLFIFHTSLSLRILEVSYSATGLFLAAESRRVGNRFGSVWGEAYF